MKHVPLSQAKTNVFGCNTSRMNIWASAFTIFDDLYVCVCLYVVYKGVPQTAIIVCGGPLLELNLKTCAILIKYISRLIAPVFFISAKES